MYGSVPGNIVSGVFTPVLAKHSKSFSLIDCISVGIDRMQRNFEAMRKQVEAWVAEPCWNLDQAGLTPNLTCIKRSPREKRIGCRECLGHLPRINRQPQSTRNPEMAQMPLAPTLAYCDVHHWQE